MRPYNKLHDENNAQLGFEFAPAEDERPSNWAVRLLAARVGISDWHARAALAANGLDGQRDE
jgi:hypothetical protein